MAPSRNAPFHMMVGGFARLDVVGEIVELAEDIPNLA